ncbi:MAG: hypothetical protein WA624_14970 [Methylocella sp.]
MIVDFEVIGDEIGLGIACCFQEDFETVRFVPVIGVENGHPFTGRVDKRRVACPADAYVLWHTHAFDPCVFAGHRGYKIAGAVGRSIVDDYDFDIA